MNAPRLLTALAALAVLGSPRIARADDAGTRAPKAALSSEPLRWTDAQGGIHYTDDPSEIPADRRSSVRQTEGVLAVEGAGAGMAASPVPAHRRRAPEGEGENEPHEATWRSRFATAHQKIADAENKVKALQDFVNDPGAKGTPAFTFQRGLYLPNPEVVKAREELVQAQQRVGEAQAELEALDREASRASVPRDWRK